MDTLLSHEAMGALWMAKATQLML